MSAHLVGALVLANLRHGEERKRQHRLSAPSATHPTARRGTPDTYLLAHDEHALVLAHLLVQRRVKGITHGHLFRRQFATGKSTAIAVAHDANESFAVHGHQTPRWNSPRSRCWRAPGSAAGRSWGKHSGPAITRTAGRQRQRRKDFGSTLDVLVLTDSCRKPCLALCRTAGRSIL